ncbi:MAG TPA: trypsin-like peptidase domain-containing protein [Acidimicrobiales bacterium]|nr:trypsin-like peptidase domain-containing protein [Acidimicrobiales bacterium]
MLVAAVVAAVVGGLIGAVVAHFAWSTDSGSAGACAGTSVADEVLPSVVTISANGARGQAGGTGSGEIIRSDGYILTNNHVVSVAANGGSVEVLLSDGRSYPATIVGRDPQTDLAVLKASDLKSPKVIALGQSENLAVGQPVVALGAPLGLSSSVTSGLVSALGRTVQVPGDNDASALLADAIQTDASINPGNSGGALVDCSGDLVGIPTAGATVPGPSGQSSAGSIGIGFAIPVNLATLVADEIINTGTVSHAFLGLQAAPISASVAQQAGVTEGLYVSRVTSAGPAADAGLRAGDVITEVNGEAATSADQLVALTLTKRAGDTVALTYQRDGQSKNTTLTLGRQP